MWLHTSAPLRALEQVELLRGHQITLWLHGSASRQQHNRTFSLFIYFCRVTSPCFHVDLTIVAKTHVMFPYKIPGLENTLLAFLCLI